MTEIIDTKKWEQKDEFIICPECKEQVMPEDPLLYHWHSLECPHFDKHKAMDIRTWPKDAENRIGCPVCDFYMEIKNHDLSDNHEDGCYYMETLLYKNWQYENIEYLAAICRFGWEVFNQSQSKDLNALQSIQMANVYYEEFRQWRWKRFLEGSNETYS